MANAHMVIVAIIFVCLAHCGAAAVLGSSGASLRGRKLQWPKGPEQYDMLKDVESYRAEYG